MAQGKYIAGSLAKQPAGVEEADAPSLATVRLWGAKGRIRSSQPHTQRGEIGLGPSTHFPRHLGDGGGWREGG